MIPLIAAIDKQIGSVAPKDCIFRIFRDVRFSKDKNPYKTNFGAFIAKDGKKSSNAGYYIHLEPGGSFLAGGMYMPRSPVLKAVRNEIFQNSGEFKTIISDKQFKQYFPELYGEKLATYPRGFPKDFPDMDLLRYKSYTVLHTIDEKTAIAPDFTDYATEVFSVMYPFNKFLNACIETK